MGRIRSVHPDQWVDEAFVVCSPLARLLALGLRNVADDNGVFEGSPVKLKLQILPADDAGVAALLEELEATNQIRAFELDGKRYGLVRNFLRFQSPRRPTYRYPLPEWGPRYLGAREEGVSGTGDVPHTGGSASGELFPGGEKGEGKRRGAGEERRVAAPPATGDGESPTLMLPCLRAEEYPVYPADIREWGAAYPAVEVATALLRMRQWLLSNPAKMKTQRGCRRFITSWLERDQNRGGGGAGGAGGGGGAGVERSNRSAAEAFAEEMGGSGYTYHGEAGHA